MKDPIAGKHFVNAPPGYPIRGVWVDKGKTVHFIHPGPSQDKKQKLQYQIAADAPRTIGKTW